MFGVCVCMFCFLEFVSGLFSVDFLRICSLMTRVQSDKRQIEVCFES